MEKVDKAMEEAIDLVRINQFRGALPKVNDIFGEIEEELELLNNLQGSLYKFNRLMERAKIGIDSILTHDAKYFFYDSPALKKLKNQEEILRNLRQARRFLPELSEILNKTCEKLNSKVQNPE